MPAVYTVPPDRKCYLQR